MTFKIEMFSEARSTVLMLIGRMQAEHIAGLKLQMETLPSKVVLDLDDLTLVDAEAVRFLKVVEAAGTELRNCPPFIREWISRE
jgi:anti-anti-sigma regulatory factor